MGARFLSDVGVTESPTAACACCQQTCWEWVEVSPIHGGTGLYFCLSCCADITAAANEANESAEEQ